MTWTKLGAEFFPECLHHGLSDAMVRTHAEAVAYLYEVEETSCRIPKRIVRTFAGSEDFSDAIKGLVSIQWWADQGSSWELLHHADVIRQSIAAQQNKKARNKRAQQGWRERQQESKEGSGVSDDVSAYTDRQTDRHLESRDESDLTRVGEACEHGKTWGCRDCKRERESA